MADASFKDLCLDAADPEVVGTFWASALGGRCEVLPDGDVRLHGCFPLVWIDRVPEPKVGKNRVHLDVYAPAVQPLVDLGASVLADHGRWQVLADPEGNELCVFPGDEVKPFAVCVDSADPVGLAAWWRARFGGELFHGPDGRPRWQRGGAGLGDLLFKCVQVDDGRTVKNRSHWDVFASVDDLVAAGATVQRTLPDWTVMVDPQGNEFCAFAPPATG